MLRPVVRWYTVVLGRYRLIAVCLGWVLIAAYLLIRARLGVFLGQFSKVVKLKSNRLASVLFSRVCGSFQFLLKLHPNGV